VTRGVDRSAGLVRSALTAARSFVTPRQEVTGLWLATAIRELF
jgi:hypothetical protein